MSEASRRFAEVQIVTTGALLLAVPHLDAPLIEVVQDRVRVVTRLVGLPPDDRAPGAEAQALEELKLLVESVAAAVEAQAGRLLQAAVALEKARRALVESAIPTVVTPIDDHRPASIDG